MNRSRNWVAPICGLGLIVPLLVSFALGGDPPAADGASASAPASDRKALIAFTRRHLDGKPAGINLWTARPDGSQQRLVRRGESFFPEWSPDRLRLIFDVTDEQGNQQIAIVRRDGEEYRQLTDLPGISEVPDYSPSGEQIIFDRSEQLPDEPGFHTSIWVMNADGSDPRPLFGPDSTTFDVEPEYSPDGSRITFSRLVEDPAGVFRAAVHVADADGSDPRRLTPYRELSYAPRWSPDGQAIIFNIERIEDFDHPSNGVWEVPADGGEMRMLLPSTKRLHFFKADYSPSGKQILVGCLVREQEQDDLCVMDADGENLHRITHTPGIHENWPVWG